MSLGENNMNSLLIRGHVSPRHLAAHAKRKQARTTGVVHKVATGTGTVRQCRGMAWVFYYSMEKRK